MEKLNKNMSAFEHLYKQTAFSCLNIKQEKNCKLLEQILPIKLLAEFV